MPNRSFGANTEVNPKEECKAIVSTCDERGDEKNERVELEKGDKKEERKGKDETKEKEKKRGEKICEKSERVLPYPKGNEKFDKERQHKSFKEIFKQLEIKIPLTEALQQIPACAKHMKQILAKKRYLEEETSDE
ncbi:hypothetical protein VIGAN_09118000 [Vigna angularis var. angularis]|uniref:Uncharacterized protein n=1 Tax=Vigna angularis var. angularis TaxID=157739 RepID=A0A0S3SXR2_PHAAN|nr:hypothetical protein VIGAN_09118000 [Vigna angularis var. angularis]